MRQTALLTLAAMLGLRAIGSAQATGGTIAGVVLDPEGRPIAGASVNVAPNPAHTQTDSTGHFTLVKLDGGFYHVRVRRLGFTPAEMTTDLSKNGHVDLKFELKQRPALLDSVVVQERGVCPAITYAGFNCRRRFGKGLYLTDDDIADKAAVELGEVFDGVAGFRTEMRMTQWGEKPIPLATKGARCLNALINGRPLALTNPLPRYATELIAVEIYASPSDAPPEYARYVWVENIRQSRTFGGGDSPSARCSLVVYWTAFS
ncbi:MAG: hypothetical protein JWM41_95 [Gemmatimonadetes bacterium]|nr:hypothetical protein [Gemmatimonadota bacterium]